MEELLNISPVDGRYHDITKKLNPYLSEYALIKYRTKIEILWLLYLLKENIIDEKINKDEEKKRNY